MNLPGRGYSLVARLSRSPPEIQARAAPLRPARDRLLPARLERIVGRDAAVREISEQLLSSRFVSIVAPGGMGKTTVAVAVAHALVRTFAHDVSFVDLGSLADAPQVLGSVAAALGFTMPAEDGISSLIAFLGGRRTLLVLDCCEHVMATIAPLAERAHGDQLRSLHGRLPDGRSADGTGASFEFGEASRRGEVRLISDQFTGTSEESGPNQGGDAGRCDDARRPRIRPR